MLCYCLDRDYVRKIRRIVLSHPYKKTDKNNRIISSDVWGAKKNDNSSIPNKLTSSIEDTMPERRVSTKRNQTIKPVHRLYPFATNATPKTPHSPDALEYGWPGLSDNRPNRF